MLLLGLAVLLAVIVGAIENGAPTAVEAPAGFDGLPSTTLNRVASVIRALSLAASARSPN
jgi:hypothetical protein